MLSALRQQVFENKQRNASFPIFQPIDFLPLLGEIFVGIPVN